MPNKDRLKHALEWRVPAVTAKPKRYAKPSYHHRRREVDPTFRKVLALRSMVAYAVKAHGHSKHERLRNLLGCSIHEFRAHLQSQWLPGMTWQNYGEWHVDHRRPCAAFDLSKEDEVLQCFHYTNLQPMWATDNLRKSATHDGHNYRKPRKARPYTWEDWMHEQIESESVEALVS